MAVLRILIVEDETLIAMMVEDFLVDLGWNVVGVAGSLDQAVAMVRDADIDAALLDVNSNGQRSYAAADILRERGIPFVFASGYGEASLEARFQEVPTLNKPFQPDDLNDALQTVYLVADDPGRLGCVWPEADYEATEFETVIQDLLTGQYTNPVRVIAFNTAERWSEDVSEDVARELRRRRDLQMRELPVSLSDFVERHETAVRRQLTLRLV